MTGWLTQSPLLLSTAVIALGSALGRLRWRGASLGSAAVLFVAMGLSAWDHGLVVPEILGSLGLVLFAYSIGLENGPGFFASARSNGRPFVVVGVGLAVAAGVAGLGGWLLGLPAPQVAGAFAGATTNTPAMAAAAERASDDAAVAVGYAITYPAGVLVMLFAAHRALRRDTQRTDHGADLVTVTAVVSREDSPTPLDLVEELPGPVVLSRLRRAGSTQVLTRDLALQPGDEVVVVGPPPLVDSAVTALGRRADRELHLDGAMVRHQWFTVSSRRSIGRRVGDLDLPGRAGGVVTRVRRLDTELLATDDLVLQGGDRVLVAASRTAMPTLKDFLGDQEHTSADINPVGLMAGLALALALGQVPLPVPGMGTFRMGSAAAALLVTLTLGQVRRTGPLVWAPSRHVTGSMTQLGLLLFLTYAGGRAGGALAGAVSSPAGAKTALLGLAVTVAAGLVLVRLAPWGGAGDGPFLAGFLAGTQTQPAVLGMADDRTGHDARVGLGYAAAYPVAMVLKIVLAQILVL